MSDGETLQRGNWKQMGPFLTPKWLLQGGLSLLSQIFGVGGKQEGLVPPWALGLVFGRSGPLPVQLCSNFRDRPFDFFLKFLILAANLRGPPGRGRQRHTHGQGGQRRLDGLFLRVLHPPLPHRDAGAPAGDQHRHQDHLRPARWVLLSLAS